MWRRCRCQGRAAARGGGLVLALEAEIRAVVGVLIEERLILEADVGALGSETGQLLGRVVEAARFGFVVNNGDVAEIEVAVAAADGLAAERGIVEGDLEALVEAADRLEERAADSDAGAGEGGGFARDAGEAEIAGGVGGQADEAVAGDAADTEHDAGMLDGAVRVEQLGADDADAGGSGPAGHRLEPAGLDDLGVVIEEKQDVLHGGGGGDIVEVGVVEGAGIAEDGDLRVVVEAAKQLEGVGLVGAVVDDDEVELVGGVGGDGADAVDAGAEQGGVIAGGNDDGDAGLGPGGGRDGAERGFWGGGVSMEEDAGDAADGRRVEASGEGGGPFVERGGRR